MGHGLPTPAGYVDWLQSAMAAQCGYEPRCAVQCTSNRLRPRIHIGGVRPSRPTETAAASSVPSSFLFAAAMNILAPALSSLLSPGTPFTICATVALVMVLLGMRSQGR